jgi:hypothetical protein
MKTQKYAIYAALLVTGAAGFMIGRNTKPEITGNDEAAGPPATRSSRASQGSSSDSTRSGTARDSRTSSRKSMQSTVERLARLESIVRGENPLDRNRALLAFIDQLAPEDFEEAIAHFRSLGITEDRFGEYSLLLSAWAKTDPLSALDYARENTRGGFATNTILTTWASIDPQSAIRWAESNHTGDEANPYMVGVIRGIAGTDPELATTLLTGMPRSSERGDALDAVLPYLLAKGNDAARAWIENIRDEALRSGAMLRVAERLAASDPAGTAAWLAANPSEATQRRMDNVYNTWARQDERAAMASLQALPPGENRSNALRGILNSIAENDPAKAVSIMDRYPSDINDRVVQDFVWNSYRSNPAIAVDQIARITNTNWRDHMYRRALGRWQERDPAAANAWMQTNPIPEPVREYIQRESKGTQN